MRARRNQPAASAASRIAVFTSSVTPYDVFQSCERCSSSKDARTTPVTARRTTPPAASKTARPARRIPHEHESEQRPNPGSRPQHVQHIRDDVHPIEPRVERVPRDGRDDCKPECEHESRTKRAPLERRRTRERRDDDRSDEAGAECGSGSRLEPDAVRLLRCAESGEHRRRRERQRNRFIAHARDECEESDADGAEQAGEEEPTR